jgi:phage head maturation protease
MQNILIDAQIKALEGGNFQVVASTGDVDRMGDRINPDGWFLTNYKKNPVMLWGHDSSIPAVARANKSWVENGKLMIDGVFAPTPFAQELRMLVENGFLNTVSVGFYPLKADEKGNIEIETKMYRRMTEEEIKKSIYDNEYGVKFDKQELLEVSWVNVPALPQALVTARKQGLVLMTKALEVLNKDEPEEVKVEEVVEDTEEKQGKVLSAKTLSMINKSISSMGEAIGALESLLSEVEADKSIVPVENKRSHAHEVAKKRVSPELRYLRTAYKAIEQVIIKEKNK